MSLAGKLRLGVGEVMKGLAVGHRGDLGGGRVRCAMPVGTVWRWSHGGKGVLVGCCGKTGQLCRSAGAETQKELRIKMLGETGQELKSLV